MLAKPHDYSRSRRRQAIWFTILGAILSIGLVIALILFCYQSNHLRI